jgi:hypothetical protein
MSGELQHTGSPIRSKGLMANHGRKPAFGQWDSLESGSAG